MIKKHLPLLSCEAGIDYLITIVYTLHKPRNGNALRIPRDTTWRSLYLSLNLRRMFSSRHNTSYTLLTAATQTGLTNRQDRPTYTKVLVLTRFYSVVVGKKISVFINSLAESELWNGWVTKDIYFAMFPVAPSRPAYDSLAQTAPQFKDQLMDCQDKKG
jgi:hypothetical protein